MTLGKGKIVDTGDEKKEAKKEKDKNGEGVLETLC